MKRLAPAAALALLSAAGCGPGAGKPATQPAGTTVKVQDSCQYHEQLASECANRRDWPCANEHLDAAIRRCPESDKFVYEKALYFQMAGEFPRCLETAKKAEAMKNEVGMARHLQAQCLYDLKRDAEADAILAQLCDDPLFTQNASSCGQLGERRLVTGDLEGAKTVLSRMVQLSPEDPRGQYYLGEIARRRKEWTEGARRCGVAFSLAQKLGMKDNFLPKFGPLYARCAAECEFRLGNKIRGEELCQDVCELASASESCQQCQKFVAGVN